VTRVMRRDGLASLRVVVEVWGNPDGGIALGVLRRRTVISELARSRGIRLSN
jgi:hypothetical protein